MSRHATSAIQAVLPAGAGFMATAWTEHVMVPIAVAIIATTPAIVARYQSKRHAVEQEELGGRLSAVEAKVDLLVDHFLPHPGHE